MLALGHLSEWRLGSLLKNVLSVKDRNSLDTPQADR